MAIGDSIGAIIASVANGSYATIQPGAGVEWIVHNLYIPKDTAAEIHVYNGTTTVIVDVVAGSYLNFFFHATNTFYLRIKNTSGSSQNYAYDGIQVK